MAERNDWDRNRDREQEIDRERGSRRLDTQRNRESRGYDAGRWENEGGRYEGENEGRGNYPRYEDRSRDYDRDYRDDYRRDRERAEGTGGSRTADFGHRGDWGRQGSWGTYGNRPNYDERGRYSGQWASGNRSGEFFRHDDEGLQHNQIGGMSAGHSTGGWTSGSVGGYGSSYGGGLGSPSGGFGYGNPGSYGREQGRHAGRGPKNWQRSDERIREEVNERLTDHPHIDATEIDVQVKNGEVTLAGTVESRNIKRLAEDVAESVSGVKEVHNQLRALGAGLQQPEMAHSAGSQGSGGGTQNRK